MNIRFLALLPLAFLLSCGGNESDTDGSDSAGKDSVVQEPVEVDETSTSLPSPLRVATMFKRSGLKYLPGLTNGTEKASSYQTKFALAQIMGVYSADMAYCVSNKQSNEAQKYLKTIRDVGTQINLGKVFSETSLFDRFNKNIDNEDSLGSILADIQYQTDQQLSQNQQTEMYGVIYAGAWIEAMSIGGQIYMKEGNENITMALLEQMAVCKGIIQELEKNKDADPAFAGLITEMKGIQTTIDNMPSMKKMNENPDMELSDVHATKEEVEPVIKAIEALRTKIING
jgi:hypothetical protein